MIYPRHLPFANTGVTVELGEIVENGVDIWDFEYPVPRSIIEYNGKTAPVDFDKEAFQQKIIDHYRFHQIGQETVGRFLHCFRSRIREIMPYYIKLYEFDAIFHNIEDPLESYHLEEIMDKLTNGRNTTNSSTTGTQTATATRHDTPQGTIDNIDDHLTEANKTNGNSTGTANATSTDNGTEKYNLVRKGNIGVQPLGGEVENIRHAFINIDMQIIDELRDLFLMVY